MATKNPKIFQLFSRLLDYPTPGLAQAARQCARQVEPYTGEATSLLSAFADFAGKTSLGRLQEIYSDTFDLKAAFQPYVGYHLFGDTYNRSPFLIGLNQRFREQGFQVERELPDHLAVMLRFLGMCTDPVLSEELIREALIPSLARMTQEKSPESQDAEDVNQPAEEEVGKDQYLKLLQSLQFTLLAISMASEHAPAD